MLPYRFSKGYCHVAALAFLAENPRLRLLAHIGYHRNYDVGNEEYSNYEYDHIVAYDPKSGRAYDAFGVHPNAEEAVSLTQWPSEDTDFWTDISQITIDDIRKAVKDGKLKPFNTKDFNQARLFARKILSNEMISGFGPKDIVPPNKMQRGNRLRTLEGEVINFPKKQKIDKKRDLIADVDRDISFRKSLQLSKGGRVKYGKELGTIISGDNDRFVIKFDNGIIRIIKKKDYWLKPYDPTSTSIFDN